MTYAMELIEAIESAVVEGFSLATDRPGIVQITGLEVSPPTKGLVSILVSGKLGDWRGTEAAVITTHDDIGLTLREFRSCGAKLGNSYAQTSGRRGDPRTTTAPAEASSSPGDEPQS